MPHDFTATILTTDLCESEVRPFHSKALLLFLFEKQTGHLRRTMKRVLRQNGFMVSETKIPPPKKRSYFAHCKRQIKLK